MAGDQLSSRIWMQPRSPGWLRQFAAYLPDLLDLQRQGIDDQGLIPPAWILKPLSMA
jgi:hypothetical protein